MMQVLLLGDADRWEMQPVVAWLTARTASLHRASSIADVSDNRQFDLIVVLESHPDEFTAVNIDWLVAASPLARIVCCAGGWSESAGRTRKIWPLALRVPVTAAIARLEQEWNLLTHANLSLPLLATGSREEWFATHHRELERESRHALRVRVISADPHYRQMLLINLISDHLNDEEADVILWDVDPWSDAMRDAIHHAAQTTSIVALANWITPDREDEMLSCGVRAVVSKLGNLQQVREAIQFSK